MSCRVPSVMTSHFALYVPPTAQMEARTARQHGGDRERYIGFKKNNGCKNLVNVKTFGCRVFLYFLYWVNHIIIHSTSKNVSSS